MFYVLCCKKNHIHVFIDVIFLNDESIIPRFTFSSHCILENILNRRLINYWVTIFVFGCPESGYVL